MNMNFKIFFLLVSCHFSSKKNKSMETETDLIRLFDWFWGVFDFSMEYRFEGKTSKMVGRNPKCISF